MPRGYLLSQSKYVADILKRTRLTDNKTVYTPIEVNAKYSTSDGVHLFLHYTILLLGAWYILLLLVLIFLILFMLLVILLILPL